METNKKYPLASELMRPAGRYFINGKYLCQYLQKNRNPGAPYSLYWEDETNPIQSGMNALEVLRVIQGFLTPQVSEDYYWKVFHNTWSSDRCSEDLRKPDYNKKAWQYIQSKMQVYFKELAVKRDGKD